MLRVHALLASGPGKTESKCAVTDLEEDQNEKAVLRGHCLYRRRIIDEKGEVE